MLTAQPAAERQQAGARIGRYRLIRRLGHGSSGEVHEAVQLSTGRRVALKLAHENTEAVAALRREIEVLGRLQHPAAVPLLDAGSWRRRPFLVAGLAGGGSLEQHAGRPWPLDAVLAVLEPVAGVLDALHGSGFAHGDVAPRNVLLNAEGSAWLIDFAGATRLGCAEPERAAMGTLGFIAPEILCGGPPSAAADRYSLAALAYLLLCGVPPNRVDPAAGDPGMDSLPAPVRP
ncbi:MAG: serine/threonine protein kinase, partial [Actinomycetota bacterium]|nr:serine/threonine protein kinase [Actinomycetota bacterium]